MVTTDDLNRDGARNKLSPAQAAQAASQAGLAVISDKLTLPEAPLSSTVFKDLLRNLNNCQVPTIPELLHPGSGTFRIVAGYECVKNPALRLDTAAIEQRKTEAGKAITPSNDAKLDALRKLSDADQRKVDLRDVALYHLMELVADTQPIMAKQELTRVGVEASDAAIIAALLQRRQKATQVNRLDQVLNLLAEGQLKEAENLANMLPDGDEKAEAGQAGDGPAQGTGRPAGPGGPGSTDEAQAEKLLRDAARVSREDADERLRRLPLSPPGPVTATGDGDSVKVFWQRGLGHDESTVYVVARTTGRAPAAPGDGTQVHRGAGTECADSGAPGRDPGSVRGVRHRRGQARVGARHRHGDAAAARVEPQRRDGHRHGDAELAGQVGGQGRGDPRHARRSAGGRPGQRDQRPAARPAGRRGAGLRPR